ncbi:hypothetical protein F2Q69_00050089 [Brassica cretica]|uniref:Uncharacterized protein n=1 Tax=Brassica cretica TaxID=69181 RepID=A0A8S9PXU4_BRACR|nr:hypothetical protein F2Q69_00050089 [Brassica cretica]
MEPKTKIGEISPVAGDLSSKKFPLFHHSSWQTKRDTWPILGRSRISNTSNTWELFTGMP